MYFDFAISYPLLIIFLIHIPQRSHIVTSGVTVTMVKMMTV